LVGSSVTCKEDIAERDLIGEGAAGGSVGARCEDLVRRLGQNEHSPRIDLIPNLASANTL
jgi:hypothetical protein